MITDSSFLPQVFFRLVETGQNHSVVKLFDISREAELSSFFDASGIQESFRFRALHRARKISLLLVDEKGEIQRDLLKKTTALLKSEGNIFYPQGSNDALILDHFLRLLPMLDTDEILRSIRKFQGHLVHTWAEQLVFQTLGIYKSKGRPTDAQIKAAVLTACLTPLRQNVGSCFATAPAILIQKDQVSLLLDDLYQLLFTGKLTRTFGGVEYSLPLSPSTGVAELQKRLAPSDFKLRPGYCPGLIDALECAEVLNPKDSLEQKGEFVQTLIKKLISEKPTLTVQGLIRHSLLEKFSLKEEQIDANKAVEKAQFKSAKMGLKVGHSSPMDRVANFLEKEKECQAVFKGMCDNALLKGWEFTLASFSEVKMEFSRWNLYTSLGFAHDEPGGLGEVIYHRVEEKISELNKKLEEYQSECQIAFDQVRSTETLMRNVSSESEGRRLQAEYQSRAYHLRICQELRDKEYSKGTHYTQLYSFLVQEYDQKFPQYFQEIYDAQMQDFQGDLYDDSPAGFRLVYKHGRIDPSVWTMIDDADQYIDSLVDFFLVTESQIVSLCDWEGSEKDILEFTSAIIAHLRSPIFLQTALQRMSKAHQTPLNHHSLASLKSIEKKPWAYTSGGTMTTLLKTYYCQETELIQEEQWVETEVELLIFILDTLKNLPPKITAPYLKKEKTGMLMTSPTHAFVLLPGIEEFSEGWQEEIFTYTWVRDTVLLPSQHFYAQIQLSSSEQTYLLSKFRQEHVPHLKLAISSYSLTVKEFRDHLIEELISLSKVASQKQTIVDVVDAFLYQHLPLVPKEEWKDIARQVLSEAMSDKIEEVPDVETPFLTAYELRDLIKGCYLLAAGTICLNFDLHDFVAKQSRRIGLAPPTPLLFADTNWAGYFFGFVVNPGTSQLELWRMDKTLSLGTPMSSWKPYLNGTVRKTWSIFTHS